MQAFEKYLVFYKRVPVNTKNTKTIYVSVEIYYWVGLI